VTISSWTRDPDATPPPVRADPDGLDRGNRHERLGQPSIELAIPLDVAAEADRDARGDDLERAAERVAGLAGAIDLRDHRLLELRIHAPERRIVGSALACAKSIRSRSGTVMLPSVKTWLEIRIPACASSCAARRRRPRAPRSRARWRAPGCRADRRARTWRRPRGRRVPAADA
jgi:hypothetical protein